MRTVQTIDGQSIAVPEPIPYESLEDRVIESTVFMQDGLWWFWDETWSNKCGPFWSKEEACFSLRGYLKELG